eukprot:scaffold753_cov390-Pavlova_lutheri.AAC.5
MGRTLRSSPITRPVIFSIPRPVNNCPPEKLDGWRSWLTLLHSLWSTNLALKILDRTISLAIPPRLGREQYSAYLTCVLGWVLRSVHWKWSYQKLQNTPWTTLPLRKTRTAEASSSACSIKRAWLGQACSLARTSSDMVTVLPLWRIVESVAER